MTSYCLELYLPRESLGRLEDAVRQARLAAEAFDTDGIPVQYVRSTYLAEDETCFHFYEAGSAEDVADAVRRAHLPSGRITQVVESAAANAWKQ